MASTPIPLSGSVGGAPIFLTDDTLPGALVHTNPADSGTNHVVTEVLVVNPGPVAITLWTTIQGPGITPPTAKVQSQMIRIDVAPTSEGNEPRIFYVPFILAPGYSYHVATSQLTGQEPAYLIGMAETFPITGVLGYGGLIQQAGVTITSIPASNWVTVEFDGGMVTNPINVTQDPANNRFKVDAPGVYHASAYGVFLCDKDASNDRILNTRFFNETDGSPVTASPFPCGVENNSNNGSWSYTTYFEVPEALVGKWLRQEVGGAADAFANVEIKKAGVTVTRISPTI